ncbi:MAG TPA: chemotaxis protein CheB [Candidatus Deferrimicrobiaceae bacterium]
MIDVLIVEDSSSAAQLLNHILTSDPEIRIVGTVTNGADALRKLSTLPSVDVVTMDINLAGGMNGFETTRRIMETRPLPIAIISTLVGPSNDASNPFRVMVEGALAVLAKPPGPGHPDFEKRSKEVIRTVRAISEVKVIRRHIPAARPAHAVIGAHQPASRAAAEHRVARSVQPARSSGGRYNLVAIGASTGGPAVIESIFASLGPGFPLPILLVQHISCGFTEGFASWLQKSTGVPTRIARHGELPEAGVAYVAPDDQHMGVSSTGTIVLNGTREPIHGLRPAVAYLFDSVARIHGDRCIGVILTGMGSDGSKELGKIREAGGVTIAQESESCIVDGMPGQAVKMGSASFVLAPEAISRKLCTLAAE